MKCDKHTTLLYAVTDRAWTGRETLRQQVEDALKGGVTCVQLREKELDEFLSYIDNPPRMNEELKAVIDHARAIDLIFHQGRTAETYNIGGFNEWKNIDIIKVVIRTVDRLLGRPEGQDMDLITYVTDRAGHDLRYAIDSTKLQRELGWEPSLQFEEGIEKTVRWYLDNQEWMDHVTSGAYQTYYEDMYKNR